MPRQGGGKPIERRDGLRVLVIGGCGFIGSHVVDRMLARGLRVRVLDRRPEAFRPPLDGVEYVPGDLADGSQLYEVLNGMDAVVHLASTTVPSTSNLDPIADINGNLVATVRLLHIMRETGPRKLVYLSSGGTVYGVPKNDQVTEDHPLHPISSYGIVKVAIENYLHMENQLHGLQYMTLRASNPYGPRQGHAGIQGIIGTHLWRIAGNEPIEIWGDGSVVRDFIHVTDLAELCTQAVESNAVGCFNAGSGSGTSITEIVEHVRKAVAREVEIIYKPGRSYDVPRIVLDINKAKKELNWAPRIALPEGIADTWNWIRAQSA